MNVVLAPASAASIAARRIRVMIVDDAVVIRGLFARWIEAEQDLEVVASLRTGDEAVSQLDRHKPDVVLLDIEMPGLDGLTALPMLLAKRRDLVVIMASTLTRRNAEISLRALSLGAADYIPKPTNSRDVAGSPEFRRELVEKVRQLGLRAHRLRMARAAPAPAPAPPRPAGPSTLSKLRTILNSGPPPPPNPLFPPPPQPLVTASPPIVPEPESFSLRRFQCMPPRVLLIGSSTGGPQALNAIVPQLGGVFDRAPVLITQHMPPTFTTILAEHLTRLSGRPAREGQDGEEINAGNIYIAPGGKHMKVARRDGVAVIELDDGPLVNFCKPSVDPMFSSAASVWGSWVMGVVLTGMGSDGLRGAQSIVSAGGNVIAQDEETSVIWGMPGQVTQAGLCSAVLPIHDIAPKLVRLFAGDMA
ncbi:MAG TPA: chemotaxis response regulator protein-glutamate methylesterase [Pseudolabrys sp.]|nr:chemotaxis response regulator protein-glutamate methylesterase [Pseudolabrys sp.]